MTLTRHSVSIPSGSVTLEGDLIVPDDPGGVVVFAHGSGSSRHSPRNRAVADELVAGGFATLLMDLLTLEEEEEERFTRHHRFDIELLSTRLIHATDHMAERPEMAKLMVGYFGASTGAAAALVAAARAQERVRAVVSRGGRPDLAGQALPLVKAATLLIVGGADEVVLDLNRQAMAQMRAPCRLEIIPGATHLFPEPGALERVSELAADWFGRHLTDEA